MLFTLLNDRGERQKDRKTERQREREREGEREGRERIESQLAG